MISSWRDACLRIGLLCLALVLFAFAVDLWVRGEAFRYLIILVLTFLVFLFGVGALILALLRSTPSWASWLILAGLLFCVLGTAFLNDRTFSPLGSSRPGDEMVTRFAAETLAHGQNPYAWDYSDILRVYRDQALDATPFLDGAFQNRVNQPALPILLYSLASRLGADLGQGTAQTVGLITFIALLILIFLGSPQPVRPIVLFPLFVFRAPLFGSLIGGQEIVWGALLVGVVLAWQRPLARALLYGLACSFGQQAWFVAPFLVIYLWRCQGGSRRERWRQIVFFALISAGVFVLTNLPFMIWDPNAWLDGLLEPWRAMYGYRSQGLAILLEYGTAQWPPAFFFVMQASTYTILLILYWFYAPAIGQGFWIFPGIFFWFYYRGMSDHWIYWLPVILLVAAKGVMCVFSSGGRVTQSDRRTRGAIPLLFLAAILLLNLGLAIVLWDRDPLVAIDYDLPIEVFHPGLANRLPVTVRNQGDRALAPRFFVRPDYGSQALPWRVLSGPERLDPGEEGEYLIDAMTLPGRGFSVSRGGQLVVTDASSDSRLHAVLDLPAQTGYENPDRIANPDFVYWPQDGAAPAEWLLSPPPDISARTSIEPVAGRTALTLEAAGSSGGDPVGDAVELPLTRLNQTVTFPDRFALWVYRTSDIMDPAEHLYGLEIDDGQHLLWILFGESEARGYLGSEDHRYLYQRTPRDAWSLVAIDLGEIYEQLDWQQPPPSLRTARGIRYAVPQVKLSLIAADRRADLNHWVFGSIVQEATFANADRVLGHALDHPDRYYVDVGDKYRSQRNYSLAESAYVTALEYNSASSRAYFGLGEAHFWLGEYVQAREAFLEALDLGPVRKGDAHKGIGWCEFNLGNYGTALGQFEEAANVYMMRNNPDERLSLADAHNGAGWSWLQLGDCDQAVSHFEKALDLAPTLAGALDGRARCGIP